MSPENDDDMEQIERQEEETPTRPPQMRTQSQPTMQEHHQSSATDNSTAQTRMLELIMDRLDNIESRQNIPSSRREQEQASRGEQGQASREDRDAARRQGSRRESSRPTKTWTPRDTTDMMMLLSRNTPMNIPTVTNKLRDHTNYRSWASEVRAAALAVGIWPLIEGVEQDDESIHTDREEQVAQSLLMMSVRDYVRDDIQRFNLAFDMWHYLKHKYDVQRFAQFHQALQQFCGLNYANYKSVEAFEQKVYDLKRTCDQYTNDMPEIFFCSMVIQALTQSNSELASRLMRNFGDEQKQKDNTLAYCFQELRTHQISKDSTH